MWQSLKQEASQYSNYLGKELDGFQVADVQGAGDGSEDGSTRRNITIWMEDTRARVLTKALEQYPDKKNQTRHDTIQTVINSFCMTSTD